MVTIQVKRPVNLPVEKSLLLRAAQVTLDLANPGSKSDLTIVVGNDRLVRKLNHQYRGLDSTTDVLSFLSGEIDPETSDLYLGDVIISLPRAEEQAAAESHSVADELQLLVTHGVLHLLGYDHLKIAQRKKMQAIQDRILKALGVELTIVL